MRYVGNMTAFFFLSYFVHNLTRGQQQGSVTDILNLAVVQSVASVTSFLESQLINRLGLCR